MALALSLVYAWLTVFRHKRGARERVGSHSAAAGWKPTGLPLSSCKEPPRLMQGDRRMCACSLPLSTICYPTTEPPRMEFEEGQLGVLQGRKNLVASALSLSVNCILQDSVQKDVLRPVLKTQSGVVAILDIRS